LAETGAVRVEGKGIVNTRASGLGLATGEMRIAIIDAAKEVLLVPPRRVAAGA
jgi:hypothetical protein